MEQNYWLQQTVQLMHMQIYTGIHAWKGDADWMSEV